MRPKRTSTKGKILAGLATTIVACQAAGHTTFEDTNSGTGTGTDMQTGAAVSALVEQSLSPRRNQERISAFHPTLLFTPPTQQVGFRRVRRPRTQKTRRCLGDKVRSSRSRCGSTLTCESQRPNRTRALAAARSHSIDDPGRKLTSSRREGDQQSPGQTAAVINNLLANLTAMCSCQCDGGT